VAAAEKAGAKSLADMRAMPADAVMKAFRNQGGTIDGYYVPEDLSKTFAEGRQNAVDMLTGSNGAELSFGGGQKTTVDSLKTRLTGQYKDLAPLALAAYAPKNDEEAAKMAAAQSGDTMAWGQRLMADDMVKQGKQVWLYHFTFHPPGPPNNPDPGPSHASEIAYVFNNLALPHEIPDASSPELSAKDPAAIKLADQMSSYWTNFAKTGNPNGPGLPKWPAVKDLKPGETMILDKEPGKGEALSDAKIALYKGVYDRDVGIH
jgi:para-nitrobenzyl esterase